MVSLTGTSIGDTATYTCNEGHKLVGAPVLNCQSDGMWDNSPPICKREFIPRAPCSWYNNIMYIQLITFLMGHTATGKDSGCVKDSKIVTLCNLT